MTSLEEKKDYSIILIFGILICIALAFFVTTVKPTFVTNNKLDVAIQDQHTEVIDLKLNEHLDTLTFITDPDINTRFINVSVATVPIVGYGVCLKDTDGTAFYQGDIINVISLGGTDYQLELDTPLDFDFGINDGCALVNNNWAVDGSVTPIIFSVSPKGLANDTAWDITRVIFSCLGDGMNTPGDPTPDNTAFFTMDPLTNGIYIRTVNGITKNIFNAKSNFGMDLRMYDVSINTVTNKNGLFATKARRTFNGQDKNGVTLRLNADTEDTFELVVQDDLTDMTLCNAVAQGHVVE